MKTTLKDIAADTGLSIVTISTILNKGRKELYRDDTCRRVEEAANRLGYLPNHSARQLRRGRTGIISILLHTEKRRSFLPPELLYGILDETESCNYQTAITKLSDEQLTNPDYVPRLLREITCDGIVIAAPFMVPRRMVELLAGCHIPAVWTNYKREFDTVYHDSVTGYRAATQTLIELGHREIAYADFTHDTGAQRQDHFTIADRLDGYLAAMQHSGLPPRIIDRSQVTPDWIAGTVELLRQDERPSAVVCYAQETSFAVLHAAAAAGLRVPQDLSIVASGPPLVTQFGIRLAGVHYDRAEMGRTAVQMLRQKLKAPDKPIPARVLPTSMADGRTIAPPSLSTK